MNTNQGDRAGIAIVISGLALIACGISQLRASKKFKDLKNDLKESKEVTSNIRDTQAKINDEWANAKQQMTLCSESIEESCRKMKTLSDLICNPDAEVIKDMDLNNEEEVTGKDTENSEIPQESTY